jgi:hypothetical protein
VTVDDTQATWVQQADDNAFSAEQLRDVREESFVEHLRLLDAPTEAVHGHALPCREELRELVNLVAERDPRRRLNLRHRRRHPHDSEPAAHGAGGGDEKANEEQRGDGRNGDGDDDHG